MGEIRAAEAPKSLGGEIVSAYVASGARIASWVLISAWVYRREGPFDFGLLALVRGTIGILNYTSLGLAPAMIRFLAETTGASDPAGRVAVLPASEGIEYATPRRPNEGPEGIVFSSGFAVATMAAAVGVVITFLYGYWFDQIHHVADRLRGDGGELVVSFGLGIVLRLFSDVSGSLLQTRGEIRLDNTLLAVTECVWVMSAILMTNLEGRVAAVGTAFVLASIVLLVMRLVAVTRLAGTPWPPRWRLIRAGAVRRILSFGVLVWFAQLADYLYAPTDYLLIGHLLNAYIASVYAPAVQIDSGLLLLVGGLAGVLLPRAAVAHADDDRASVRRYYVRGTLASLALLLTASLGVWLLSGLIFRLWLGNSMPATRAILPLMLVNSVLGGSSAVGRSVLLATGHVKPFTISVLVAGIVNVAASWGLVHYAGLGLTGIVLGTVIAVMGRCALWMPWYVLSVLRAPSNDIELPADRRA